MPMYLRYASRFSLSVANSSMPSRSWLPPTMSYLCPKPSRNSRTILKHSVVPANSCLDSVQSLDTPPRSPQPPGRGWGTTSRIFCEAVRGPVQCAQVARAMCRSGGIGQRVVGGVVGHGCPLEAVARDEVLQSVDEGDPRAMGARRKSRWAAEARGWGRWASEGDLGQFCFSGTGAARGGSVGRGSRLRRTRSGWAGRRAREGVGTRFRLALDEQRLGAAASSSTCIESAGAGDAALLESGFGKTAFATTRLRVGVSASWRPCPRRHRGGIIVPAKRRRPGRRSTTSIGWMRP